MGTQASLPVGRAKRRQKRLATIRSIMALMLREMSTTYSRSPGGYLWAVLEPAGGIALLSAVFALGFRHPPIGISFPMFFATGLLPFIMFTDLHGKTATCLMFSKQLLAYNRVTFIDAIIARFLLNAMTQLLVGYIILASCLIFYETRTTLDLQVVVQAYALTGALALGIGMLNAYIFMRFNLFQRFWSIIMRPMLIVSGVLIPYETIPQPYRDYLWYNPLVHLIGLMRSGFYGFYEATYVSPAYVMGIALTCMVIGIILLQRHHKDLLAI